MNVATTHTHIIWLQTSFLGDIVLTTAAMSFAKAKWPHLRQVLVTTPVGKAALAKQSYIDDLVVFDKRARGLRAFGDVKRELRKLGALERGVILQPHRSFRSSLLSRYLGKRTITYNETAGAFLADVKVSRVAILHEAARIGLLLEPLGATREEIVKARPLLVANTDCASPLWQQIKSFSGHLIGIAPGSVWATKRWLPEGFAKLTEMLLERENMGVVLLGSQDEKAAALEIHNRLGPHPRLWNLVGETTIQELPAIYKRLKMLVSNDSSPIHYGSALNVPTVAVFGATVPGMGFGPLAPNSAIVEEKDLNCRPCSDHGPQTCPLGHFLCMKKITPERVFQACKQIFIAF